MAREIRLDQLETIDIIEQKTVDEILEEIRQDAQIADITPSDPAGRVVHGWAVRESKRRAEEHENAKSMLLAFATGDNLDFIGKTYYRKSDGSPILRKEGESCEDYRIALQRSPEGLTSAGTVKSYNFHASRAHALLNLDKVSAHSPEPMKMSIYFMLEPSDLQERETMSDKNKEVKAAIEHHLKPFVPSDEYEAIPATKVTGTIAGTVKCVDGIGLNLIKDEGLKRLNEYLQECRIIKGLISLDGIHIALRGHGVRRVLMADWVDIECGDSEYPEITNISLTYEAF